MKRISKETKQRLEWLFLIVVTLMVMSLLSSCKAKETTVKTNTEIKANISENTVNNIDVQTEAKITEDVKESQSKESQSNQIEDVSITHRTVKYDTDKPIDPVTGKHPVLEEKETIINRQTKGEDNFSEHKTTAISKNESIQEQLSGLLVSNSKKSLLYASKNEVREKTTLSTIQKALLALGCIGLGIGGFSIYRWIKK